MSRWGDGVRRDARRMVMQALSGVGSGETIEHEGGESGYVWHFRRGLNDEETGMLSKEWLAIPARHPFSFDGSIETRL
jgi:hypothetical protein